MSEVPLIEVYLLLECSEVLKVVERLILVDFQNLAVYIN
jgi:hypothetical protein